ncbi:MAG: proton-conducting transporter membrane subunit [Clostridiaceae bacterium]
MNSVLFLVVIPLLGTFISLFNKKVKEMTFLITLFNELFTIYIMTSVSLPKLAIIGGFIPPYGINFVLTDLSVLFIFLVNTAGLISMFVNNEKKSSKFYSVYLVLLAANNGLVLTGDLFNMFIFLELSTFAITALITYKKNKVSSGTGIKYLILSSVSSSFLLIGIGIIYKTLGTLNIADIAGKINLLSAPTLSLIILLIFAGILVEIEIFPFNIWVPKAYISADLSVNVMLFGILGSSASYVMARVIFTMLSVNHDGKLANLGLRNVITIFAVLTIIISELAAYSEKKMKKILAFSSMGQMGLILYGFILANKDGIIGALILVTANFLSKIVLLILNGEFEKISGSDDYRYYKGIGRDNKIAGIAFTIAALSLMGIPLTAGFIGKLNLIEGAVSLGGINLYIVAAILAVSVVEGIYFLKISHSLFLPKEKEFDSSIKYSTLFIALILSALIVIIGLLPNITNNFVNAANEILNSTNNYINVIIH